LSLRYRPAHEATAQEALDTVLSDARRGTLPDSRARSGRTFGDACAEWLRYVGHDKQRAPSTLADYRNVVNSCLLPEFGKDTPLERITTERIEQYRERLLDEARLTRRSIQKVLVLLYGILKRAKRWKWIASAALA
jgi:Phage integrase, N-terminal SAM-like domain